MTGMVVFRYGNMPILVGFPTKVWSVGQQRRFLEKHLEQQSTLPLETGAHLAPHMEEIWIFRNWAIHPWIRLLAMPAIWKLPISPTIVAMVCRSVPELFKALGASQRR